MELDITLLNRGIKNTIEINNNIFISTEKYQHTDIKELKNLKLCGSVNRTSSDTITLKAELSGIMVLEDSISLELIDYNFSSQIDEKLEEINSNLENVLDITDILWQNIILEVPLKLSMVKDFNKYQGDGWKLVDEDSIKSTNNPFSELRDIMGEE